jgi:hypothetical protein
VNGHLAPRAPDDADRVPLLEYRNRHECSVFQRPLKYLAGTRIVVEFSQYILELHRLAVHECSTHDEVAGGATRKKTVKGIAFLGRQVIEGH